MKTYITMQLFEHAHNACAVIASEEASSVAMDRIRHAVHVAVPYAVRSLICD
jgi:hypothetical protein